jgi:hypothetical protein
MTQSNTPANAGHSLGKRLARAWNTDDHDRAANLVERMINHSNSDFVYQTALDHVEHKELINFQGTMMAMAGSGSVDITDKAGRPLVLDADPFLIPVFGQSSDVQRLLSSNTMMTDMARMMVASGMMSKNSIMLLNRHVVDINKAANFTPRGLRTLLDSASMQMIGDQNNVFTDAVFDSGLNEDVKTQQNEHISLILGFRFIPADDAKSEQKFDGLSPGPEWTAEDIYKCRADFLEEMAPLLLANDLGLMVAAPSDWTGALEEACFVSVQGQIAWEGVNRGRDALHPEAQAHLTFENETLLIAFQEPDGTWLGPAILENCLKNYADSVISTMLNSPGRPAPLTYSSLDKLRTVMTAGRGRGMLN